MPRNRYTKLVRKSTRAQIARQEAELRSLAQELRQPSPDFIPLSIRNEQKEKRSARVKHRRRAKPEKKDN
ncbi:hypothetical protein [Amycolatopsis vastitatis]|uniref:hypothetical protein n=1 Tax=Amycolatopsis vastitatis TaxID=1905142 RepID=UPI0011784A0F|nr:hypothetical protein [Amycolatopsis vastitatis]